MKKSLIIVLATMMLLCGFSIDTKAASAGTVANPYDATKYTTITFQENSITSSKKIGVQLTQTWDGSESAAIVKNSNTYNTVANSNQQWIVFKFKIKYISGTDDTLDVSDVIRQTGYNFYYSTSGGPIKAIDTAVLSSELMQPYDADLFIGATTEVYIGALFSKTQGYPLINVSGYTSDYKKTNTFFKTKEVKQKSSIQMDISDQYLDIYGETTVNATVKNTPSSKIYWSIGNSNIASVNRNGVISGFREGNTYVYAESITGQKVKRLIKVRPKVNAITMNTTSKSMKLNETYTFSVSTNPLVSGSDLKWSTGNSKIATVDKNGKVTAKGIGNTYVYVKTWNGKEAKALVKVLDPIISIKLNFSTKTISVGNKYTFTSSLTPNNTSTIISWRTGNPKIATVNTKGEVTALSPGNTYVYATTASGKEAKCLIKVIPSANRVSIRYTSKTIRQGASFKFNATVKPIGVSQSVSWRTGNSAIAIVDSTGKVTAKSTGNTYLYAKTANGKETKCLIKVVK